MYIWFLNRQWWQNWTFSKDDISHVWKTYCVCLLHCSCCYLICCSHTEINPCDNDNGHCSENANCTKTLPGERSCTCHEGFSGDGVVCLGKFQVSLPDLCAFCKCGSRDFTLWSFFSEIDNCLVNNGGCHNNAECIKIGPRLVRDHLPF